MHMLRIDNLTRNTTVIEQGRVADNFLTKFRGLMGVRHLPQGDGLLITGCNSVHTHFMRIPIDVLYIDKHNRVVDIDPSMNAWRIGRARKSASYVLEVPSGTAERTGCTVGDQLLISVA
ncbi:MAG TPA: DUF192 domain-containing protein [Caldilineaceae bacterium]|nr:DUF192 domain-containing protein [Caldilineaceae bacterium]